jgi:hypothetical protein
MQMDTSTKGLLIALVGAGLVISSEYFNSSLVLFAGLLVGYFGITTIIRSRQEEDRDEEE